MTDDQDPDEPKRRLSDLILVALECAIAQRDETIASLLLQSMDLSMTRYAGGKDFVERRTMPPSIARALERLSDLREANKAKNADTETETEENS